MDTIIERKIELRKHAKSIREGLDNISWSQAVTELIKKWEHYKKSKHIMLFYPINSEISLLNLLNDNNKTFYFPMTTDNEILPIKYNKKNGFKQGMYYIAEPIGEKLTDLEKLDIVFIPALSVDSKGYRLGYGKGYYDRFLKKLSNKTIKVLPIHSKLIFDKIPIEQHDMPADYIVTETSINYISVDFK